MSTTINYERTFSEFQEKWEGNTIDMMKLAMMLDASERLLETVLGRKPTARQVIEFSKVVAMQTKH